MQLQNRSAAAHLYLTDVSSYGLMQTKIAPLSVSGSIFIQFPKVGHTLTTIAKISNSNKGMMSFVNIQLIKSNSGSC